MPSISDVLERYPQVVIIGDPGSGKSTTLHYLHLVKAQQALDGKSPVPLYINLAEWPDSVPDLKSLLVHERDLKGCPSIPASRLLLLLDGLNEMREREYDARVESIQQWLIENQGAQVVVAARKQQYVQNRQLRTATVTIHPLTDPQVELFVAKYLGAEDAAGLLANIHWETRHKADARHFARLADNPFQLALLCYVYSQSGKTLPSTRGELLRILAQTVYQREADLGNHLGLTYDDMQAGLGELALAAVQARTSTAIDGTWAARRIPNGIDVDRLRRLGVDTGLIRLSKNDRFIQFSHQLVLEYFAAERLSNDLKRVTGVARKPRFQHGERRAELTDEVCFTLMELHRDPGAALTAIGDVDPVLAVDALSDNPRSESVTTESKETLAQKLIDAFSAHGERARSALINRLGVLGVAALNPLAAALRDGSKPERRLAVQALAAIDSLDAVDRFVAGLQDRNRWVRRETRDALREFAEVHPDLIDGYIRKRLDTDPAAAREMQALLVPPQYEPVRESWDREVLERVTAADMTVVFPYPAPADTAVPEPARLPLPERPTDIPGMLKRAALTVATWRAVTRRLMDRSKDLHEKLSSPDIAAMKLDPDSSTEDLLNELKVASRWRARHIIKVLVLRGNKARPRLLDFLSSTPSRSMREDAREVFAKYHAAFDADDLERLLRSQLPVIRQGALSWQLHADGVRGFHELMKKLVREYTADTTHAVSILVHLIEQVEDKPPTAIYARVVTAEQYLSVRDVLRAKREDVEARLRSILADARTVKLTTLRDQAAIALYLLLEDQSIGEAQASLEPASISSTVGET